MGSYDGAEICELVGLFILNSLGKKFGKENVGLYRDDGLAILKQLGLKITAQTNLHVVNFLGVAFALQNGKYKPYRKPNDDPLYVIKQSNHPPSILKQLPTSIGKRISFLSLYNTTFKESAPIYQNTLRQ